MLRPPTIHEMQVIIRETFQYSHTFAGTIAAFGRQKNVQELTSNVHASRFSMKTKVDEYVVQRLLFDINLMQRLSAQVLELLLILLILCSEGVWCRKPGGLPRNRVWCIALK